MSAGSLRVFGRFAIRLNHRLQHLVPLLVGLSALGLGMNAAGQTSPSASFFAAQSAVPTGSLSYPYRVAVDAGGNVYVSDTQNNRVLKETLANGVYTESVVVSSGLDTPYGIAVDGSGNVYIADNGHNRVVEESPSGGSYTQSVVSTTTGLSYPTGLAVDASGNLYIADTGGGKILIETPSAGSFTETVLTYSSNFAQITGIAVDSSGNIYVSDIDNQAVYEETYSAGSYTPSTIPASGLNYPYDLTVDASGNLYISDFTNKWIVLETYISPGNYRQSTLPTASLSGALGVAIGGDGNLYIADTFGFSIEELQWSAGNFAPAGVNSTTGPVSMLFQFSGGTGGTLSLTGTQVVAEGASGLDFTDAGSGTCSTSGSYNAGDFCRIDVAFSPIHPGAKLGAAQLLGGSGTPIATGNLSGLGTGPQVNFTPGTAGVVGTGGAVTNYPYQIALDGAGNMYVGNYVQDGVSPQVVKVQAGGGSASAMSTAPITLGASITGVAVDGAGNLYIADYYNRQIVVVTPAGVASVLSISGLSPALGEPTALAFDETGNLYIGDYTNGRVVKVSSLAVSGSTSTGVGVAVNTGSYSFSAGTLTGLAVGPNGTLYIAARTANSSQIIQVTAAGAVSAMTASGLTFSNPQGVAVDAAGNVYVEDSGNGRIVEVSPSGAATVVATPGLTLASGFGVTLAPSGDLMIPDWTNSRIVQIDRSTPPSLAFATTETGTQSSDSPQLVTVTNEGNADLTFPVPGSGNNPSLASGFSLDSATTCPQLGISSSAGTLAAGASCVYAVDFIPVANGADSGSMVVTDNHLNAPGPNYATQTISLSGTGLASQTITFANPDTMTYGASATLTATASSSLTVAFSSATTGICTITNGGALTIVSAGTCIIDANQAGNASYAAAPQVSQTFTIAQAATTTSLVASNGNINPGQSVTLTATVASTAGTPTGSVNFLDGSTSLGTGTLSAGVAILSTTALTAGVTNTITATYSGDTNFLTSSTTGPTSIVVAPLDFTVAVSSSASQSVYPGGTVAYVLNVAPLYGSYAGTVAFAATGLPAGATATFSPSTIAANGGPQSVLVRIQTSAVAKLNAAPSIGRTAAPLALALLFLPLLGTGRMRRLGRRWGKWLCVVLLMGGIAAAVSGCSTINPVISTITLTGSAGSMQHSTSVTLAVN